MLNRFLSLIQSMPVHAISHITGGGLLENIPRVLPDHLAAKLDSNSWDMPEIFNWLQSEGNIDINEMYRVLNCGVGMVVIVPRESSNSAIELLNASGEKAWLIGEVDSIDRRAGRYLVAMRAVILISGNGSNLQSLIDNARKIDLEICSVISNKEDAFGLKRAERANIRRILLTLIDLNLEKTLINSSSK